MDLSPLGPFGVWHRARQLTPSLGREIESLGFGTLWIGGSPPADLDLAESILAATERIVVATGIVSIFSTTAQELAASHHRVEARHPGRFLLGIGASHPERFGSPAASPLDAMRGFLDALTAEGVPRDRVVLAALGPRMLELAAERTAGAHPYLTTPVHTEFARATLGPGPLLAPEQRVVVRADPGEARAIGRPSVASPYLGLINYRRSLLRLGYPEAELDAGGSDRLIDDLVVSGDDETIARRLHEHLESGADHVAVQAITATDEDPATAYGRIAGALELR